MPAVKMDFIEVESFQKNKAGHEVCGDAFLSHKIREEGRVISVMSDGLGSGIKASVLSTITSSMLLNFARMNEDIVDASSSVLKTLPVDQVRRISYSTFCICDIDCFGNAQVAEYETPSFYLLREGRFIDVPKKKIPVERDDIEDSCLWLSGFRLRKEDRLIFFSDGVSQSGMGSRAMPFGWEEGVRDFIIDTVRQLPGISARDLARRIVFRAEGNDGGSPKDDTTCGVIYMREPRNLLVCTGPPFDSKNDRTLSKRVSEFSGKKVICGGTTAKIISRETGHDITMDMDNLDKGLPPASRMEGVDLITEGILTLSKVGRLLSGEDESVDRNSPAGRIMKLLSDSDKITFLVGTRINNAHQDPTLPIELEIRRNVVKRICRLLESKWLKDVSINYI